MGALDFRPGEPVRFGADGTGFLYLPAGDTAGAVIILHERYGLVQHTLDLARRLAEDGFAALAPDLFCRWNGDREALRRGEARVILPDPDVADVIDQALDFINAHPRAAGKRVALMGVCQSGRYPIVVASRRRDLAAVIVFYGASQRRDWETSERQPRAMTDMLRALTVPALFVFGENDHTISLEDIRRMRNALEDGRVSYRIKIFPDVPHGWLNDTMPGRYRAAPARAAWELLRAFLREVYAGAWPGTGRIRWEFAGDTAADYDFSKNVRLE